MSEITPNTPNPVREDAYVEELAEKLGIDPQYIPKSPVWRNEEEIKAIAEMFANMSGGGSGGGVLVVNVTTSGNTMTLDKTWQEIHDSSVPVFGIVRADVGDVSWLFCIDIFEGEGDFVVTFVSGPHPRDFTAASANGYPSSTIE